MATHADDNADLPDDLADDIAKLEREIADFDRRNSNERDVAKELERLIDATVEGRIAPEDFDLIVDFWRNFDRGESAITTQETHLSNLRTTAVRIATADTNADSLAEAERHDIKRLMAQYKSGTHPDVKDGGIVPNPYQSALRVFYRWHSDLPLSQGAKPHENLKDLIEIDSGYSGREFGPEDPWRQEDVDAWFDATRDGTDQGFRDRALFALTLSTGQRIDAIASLRLKHIDDTGPTMDLTLNEEDGNLKGASGTRPVLWAKQYLRPWLENHPFRDDPEAGLFVPIPGRGMNRKPDGGERDPLDQETIRGIIKDRADDAGIDRPTYFHILRKSAITRMVLNGNLNEQKIKGIVGWDLDSSQFSTYVAIADEIMNDGVRADLGGPTSGEDHPVIGMPSLDRCGECGEWIAEDSDLDRCPNPTCTQPFHHSVDSEAGDAKASVEVEAILDLLYDARGDELPPATPHVYDEDDREDERRMAKEALLDRLAAEVMERAE